MKKSKLIPSLLFLLFAHTVFSQSGPKERTLNKYLTNGYKIETSNSISSSEVITTYVLVRE